MNRNNLLRCQLYGARLVNADGTHFAVHTATMRPLGFASPPSWEDSTAFTDATAANPAPEAREFIEIDQSALPASRAILSLAKFDHETHEAMNNTRLSPTGRAEALQAPRTAVIATVAKAGGDLEAIGRECATRESAFYAAPKLPANDVQAAFEDRELRDMWRTSPVARRTVLFQQMQAGNNSRMLEALVRSPIPLEGNDAGLIAGAWRGAVDKRSPTESAALKASRANVDWADTVCRASAKYAARAVGLSHAEIAAAAAGSGGEFLFSDTHTIPASAVAAA